MLDFTAVGLDIIFIIDTQRVLITTFQHLPQNVNLLDPFLVSHMARLPGKFVVRRQVALVHDVVVDGGDFGVFCAHLAGFGGGGV